MQGYRKLNNAWHWAFIVYYITTCVASDIHTRTVWIQDHGYTLLYVFFFIFIVENYSYARNSRTSVKICGNFVQICPDEFSDKWIDPSHPSDWYFNTCCYAISSGELINGTDECGNEEKLTIIFRNFFRKLRYVLGNWNWNFRQSHRMNTIRGKWSLNNVNWKVDGLYLIG